MNLAFMLLHFISIVTDPTGKAYASIYDSTGKLDHGSALSSTWLQGQWRQRGEDRVQ